MKTSLMNSFLLLQQSPACLVTLIWMVLEMGVRWPYYSGLEWCFFLDLFSIARSILVQFPSSVFCMHLVSVHMAHPYRRIEINYAWKKLRFILLDKSDFHMIDNQLIAVHVFTQLVLMSFSVDKTLLTWYENSSTDFRERIWNGNISFLFKTHLVRFAWIYTEAILLAACFRLLSRDSAWVGVFDKSAMSSM